MTLVKLKVCTFPAKVPGQLYKRNTGFREAFIDINEKGEIYAKFGSKKWKSGLPANDPSVVKDRTQLMEGLVFKNKQDAQTFIEKNKSALDTIAKSNPAFECFKPTKIIQRFQPEANKTKVWNN